VTVHTARSPLTRTISVRTADGVALRGIHLAQRLPDPRIEGSDPSSIALVLAHGFTNDIGKPTTRAVMGEFARYGPVVALDFRGHGRSDGRSSVGRDEVLDIDAAVRFARDAGYQQVAVVGFSLGAAVALRYAGSSPGDVRSRPDAVVAVSAPSRWYLRNTVSMRRLHWMLEHPLGGLVGRVKGLRLGSPWAQLPRTPLEMVANIAPTPLLLVHGDADRYFSVHEAELLHRGAPGSLLWIEPGMGHAESGISADTIHRIAGWIASVVPQARVHRHPIDGGVPPAGDVDE